MPLPTSLQVLVAAAQPLLSETTALSPLEESQFRQWAVDNQVKDYDHPDAHYDMRGYWKDIASKGQRETSLNAQDGLLHYPDTYKQHGHRTFSQESKYSSGPSDGGVWVEGENFLPQPKMAVSHALTGLQRALKR